jgi:hypothetical protein
VRQGRQAPAITRAWRRKRSSGFGPTGRFYPGAATNEPSAECQLDYDQDGYGSLYVPAPDPLYPFAGTAWIEAGTDADDFNNTIP